MGRAERERGGVVHIVARMAPGGIETLVLDLVRAAPHETAMVSLEGDADALCADWPALADHADALEALGKRPGLRPTLVAPLAQALRRLRPRAVFAHHMGPLLYGAIAAKLAGVRRVVHVEHDVWHYDRTPGDARIVRLVERIARPAHIAVSDEIKARLGEILPTAEIVVAPPGVDFERFAPGDRDAARRRLGLDRPGEWIGAVGRLAEVKGHDVLIAALARMARPARLAIIGEGEARQALEAQIAALGLEDRVRLLGHRDDVAAALPAFDAFCQPSRNEGLPRAVMEAQACDLPVVATRVGAHAGAVAPETGRLSPPDDPGALADALDAVLAAPAQPGRARTFAAARFDFARTKAVFDAAAEGRTDAFAEIAPEPAK